MKITILTTFPEMFTPLHTSMLGRAEKAGILEIREVDIRAYSKNKHHNTDDAPFGGGAGMVMLAQPIVDAIRDVQGGRKVKRIYLSPRGETLTQKKAEQLAKEDELILLCGHYEGVDQRALDLCIDEEISIGDYVLTGGELGAMVLVDCVARLVPGVLGCEESAQTESFSSGLLEYPQYTRPREFEGLTVPEPLLNGNHAHIVDWQLSESLYITLRRRPEMAKAYLDGRKFTRQQARLRVEERQAIIIIFILCPLIFLRCAGIRVLRRRCLPCFLLHVFLVAVQVLQRFLQVAILLILLLADLISGFCALQFRFLLPPCVFLILETIQCFLG